MRKPIFFNLNKKLSLIIVQAMWQTEHCGLQIFQLYFGNIRNRKKNLCELNNYAGMLSINWENEEFCYTQGNQIISFEQVSKVIEYIKTNFI